MASYSTLLVPLINEILLKEIGEANIQPLKWTQVALTRYKFLVDIGDFTETVTVDFEKLIEPETKQFYLPQKYRNLKNIYNVGYEVSGTELQLAKSDMKTLLTILSTVVDIVKHFLDKNNIDGLYIKGTAKEVGSKDISQKSNLYKAFIKKQLEQIPNFDFDTYKDRSTQKEGFILIKNKNG
jgi:hypothetical protein